MRTNAFCKELIADQKVAEYKRTLQGKDNWRSPIWSQIWWIAWVKIILCKSIQPSCSRRWLSI